MTKGIVRIIGGKMRGKRIYFPLHDTLRPTMDRVRETLFNWLMPVINDAKCLDLFAGSGAIGFEAASRGARLVVMIDQSKPITNYLHKQISEMQLLNIKIIKTVLPDQKLHLNQQFDIVFLDPPFRQGLIPKCSAWLEAAQLLAPKAYIYVEAEKELNPLPVPAHWKLFRTRIAGNVGYHLFIREPIEDIA